ncbi:MAG: GxxExxY protein [Planctomycetes bacterium]|jgi:GxxExxY protein|nr:GxxExxY protein [Planctomycetota bacterium]
MNRQDAEGSTMNERGDAEKQRRREPSPELNALAEAVLGAAIEVHRELGPGFPESVYENALCIELELRGIPFERQVMIDVPYKGRHAGKGQLDIWVDRQLVLELKAVENVLPKHKAQGKAYLAATKNDLAYVLNFNEAVMKDGIHRIVWTDHP